MKKFFKSFHYAYQGICWSLHQTNIKVQLVVALLVIIAALALKCSGTEIAILLACSAMVLGAELMNTAIEAICDWQCSSYDRQIKTIKDLAAGAVLIIAIISVLIGVMILGPKILYLIIAA